MITLFRFPSNAVLREKWIEALKTLNNQQNASDYANSGKICALHFASGCIENRGCAQYRLKPDSVPSIFPHNEEDSTHLKDTTLIPSIKDDLKATTNTSMMSQYFSDVKGEFMQEEVVDSAQRNTVGYVTAINSDVLQTEERSENIICATPRRGIRYPGDILTPKLKDMTPDTLNECVRVLKKSCLTKTALIKRLRNEIRRQKLKITSLKKLLQELRQKYQLSENSSDTTP